MISFEFAGVHWRATFGFFAVVAAFLFVNAGGFALAFLGAAALHELGHLLAMALLRVPVRGVTLSAGGLLLARESRYPLPPMVEILLLLAGPGANLATALLLYLVGGPGAMAFSAVNSALALYHLLPLDGLDGGSLLELFCVGLLGVNRGIAAAEAVRFLFSIAALVALYFITLRYGFSLGLLLMVLVFATAVLPRRRGCFSGQNRVQ